MHTLSVKRSALGISLLSLATLMFELLVNKALSFSTWGSLGYMIIGSAIFGYSFAGVIIAIWQPHKKYSLVSLVSYASLVFSVSIAVCYIAMNIVPFNFEDVLVHPSRQILFFTIWYLSLLAPFTMTGFIISILLLSFKERNNRLYAADLIGASLGCILVVPLFPLLGASGQYLLCAAIGAFCTIIFSYRLLRKVTNAAIILMILFLGMSPFMQSFYPVKTHQEKRERGEHYAAGFIKHSMWSFLSKIEVAIIPNRNYGMIWFDGGMMQSAIDRFAGDYLKAQEDFTVNGANSIAYRLKSRKNSLIIAPAGGREVKAALAWGTERVIGVELDYSVVKLVREELNEYLGGIFHDKRVSLINDEGRSFIKRSSEKYDTIQFISAYSVTAIQSGAVDLAGSYLVTGEAFNDYLDHLTQEGVLSISHGLNLRLFFTAWVALEQKGLNPRKRLVLILNGGATLGRNTILVKLTPFEPTELKIIKEICLDNNMLINYAPSSLLAEIEQTPGIVSEPKTRQLIEEFIATPKTEREDFYAKFPYRVRPVTDDRPFFNNCRYALRDMTDFPHLLSEEMEEYMDKTWYIPYIPIGIVPRLVVLAEALFFAMFFLIFPLWKSKAEGIRADWQKLSMWYFFSLGLGFIWIEIVLLKTFILFLGSPVYSISVVLFAMLIFAGTGSFFSEKLRGPISQKLFRVGCALVVLALFTIFLYPPLIRICLGFPFYLRIIVAIALIAPIGFILGIPFPLGLTVLSYTSAESIPWAWAVNGYSTVIGVSTAALIALHTGFSVLLFISLSVYILGFLCLSASQRNRQKET